MKTGILERKLKQLNKDGIYPFHMPGHKRRRVLCGGEDIDITEISGYDDLHHASGILAQAQDRAAELFGAKKSYFLVNGSTCGILTAIFAETSRGDQILVARNCHRSVYHGAMLRGLRVEYLYPAGISMGINSSIDPADVDKALGKYPDTKAVILTSPTYDGVLSDIASIADICQRYGVKLIVDEAHGAHLCLSDRLPESAVISGADYVIQSLHKTLPAYTQSAILHVAEGVNRNRVEKYLRCFMTSSPSYLFMAAMDKTVGELTERGESLYLELEEKLEKFYRDTEDLQFMKLVRRDEIRGQQVYDFDETKLVITLTEDAGINGADLHERLRENYGLEMEMAAGNYCMGITTIMDTAEGFERLALALREIDRSLGEKSGQKFIEPKLFRPECCHQIYQLEDMAGQTVRLSDAAGRESLEFIYVYPPGIPLIVPGEILTQEIIDYVMEIKAAGLSVQGMDHPEAEMIRVI